MKRQEKENTNTFLNFTQKTDYIELFVLFYFLYIINKNYVKYILVYGILVIIFNKVLLIKLILKFKKITYHIHSEAQKPKYYDTDTFLFSLHHIILQNTLL